MKRIALFLLISGLTVTLVSGNDARDRFLEGVEKYRNEDFKEALSIWTDLYESGYDNFELLYNTGNAWYKLNEIPNAILFYERALLRKPGDEDTKYNLSIVRSRIKDRFEVIPVIFIFRWFNFAALVLPSDAWAVTSALTFIIALSLALLFLFTPRYSTKIISFWIGILFVLMAGVSLAFSFHNRNLVYRNDGVIITAPVVTGRSMPSESGVSLFVIHEGLKARSGEQIGDWCEIKLPDGNKGWVPTNAFVRI